MEGHVVKLKNYCIKTYKDLEDFPCKDLDFENLSCKFWWFHFDKFVERKNLPIKRVDILLFPKKGYIKTFEKVILIEFKTLPIKTKNNKKLLILLEQERLKQEINKYLREWNIEKKFKQSISYIRKYLSLNTEIFIFIFEDEIRDKQTLEEIYKTLNNPFEQAINLLRNPNFFENGKGGYSKFNFSQVIRNTYNTFLKELEQNLPSEIEIMNCRRFKDFLEFEL